MDDNIKSFISFTEKENFNPEIKYGSFFFPNPYLLYSLLEICCYYGAVNCFKFLRTKYDSNITSTCLDFSFLGGNPDIMNECLKFFIPNLSSMMFAIISNNIDFVTFLMNEFLLKIDLEECIKYNNLQAFLVYLDQTNQMNKCFIYSSGFNIPSLCQYFLSNGVDINTKDNFGKTALHIATVYNSIEVVEYLIEQGININSQDDEGETALHYTVSYNRKEIAEILIKHGIDANIKDMNDYKAIDYLNKYDCNETLDFLFTNFGIHKNEVIRSENYNFSPGTAVLSFCDCENANEQNDLKITQEIENANQKRHNSSCRI
ncbi:ankyrin repeat protein, putative [Trichomonas vaginalis G3]|uniref:Ankyrin repeat protein, putative n=1 Tax=Trichomonas vaginalis (strain ATCC PRA-98 / G3) TaxID=412133 RepID=A2ER25_TRIV3|nr:fatty-acyl-CoA binding [Trichomonas vaginalis G3]EAY04915.1 ankyrin repeat protein, putative [Trichomonas vaginalis G3]KAI5519427.1 fatty-acyl-CoA binding [Trichomonas vaginalis G3]|eukprot:XP_001317138.1 ankyrin repeat protein [Trichomonas vaginalis G3]